MDFLGMVLINTLHALNSNEAQVLWLGTARLALWTTTPQLLYDKSLWQGL